MLIKIGKSYIDPGEVAAITSSRGMHCNTPMEIFVQLRHGAGFWIDATMDEAEAALIDAGYMENIYEEEEDDA